MKKIVLTGGGSAGHVTPNLALISQLKKEGWEIHYIGTEDGIEKSIISKVDVTYHSIHAGKLRRYLSLENITDPFRVVKGMLEAFSIIKKLTPNVIFSKGGFVTVPVVLAGWMNRIPVIIHESDMTPGLANKLSSPFATAICTNFPEAAKNLPKNKAFYTGTPIRRELLMGDFDKGLNITDFVKDKPVIMVMGGSLGSKNLNRIIREILPKLLEDFQVVHICGKGNVDTSLKALKGYKQFEYVNEEQPHIFKIANVVVSRAGANSISEFLVLKLPNILIPLSTKASRGDQILNAKSFEKQGFSKMLIEEEIDGKKLYDNIIEIYKNRKIYIDNMGKEKVPDGTTEIMKLIRKYEEQPSA
ncbi:N-acetylglucosamine transferase [Oxobacter pfennigii]|uniref:UDP-N-acetylglucosamine--N-acetylmuramyl-(pentapeptide) pyrophosphoryl-undecaprenol N-acetylglucosamine transferase n=1 Tax=Oxobacter pfennigii TaxID=36849 RepID=A0A0P8WVK3_9CLOT|nr:undecaprenyldiphospho-muramoylpentapeptide beta-N-acetylglucosaminyltransferase [Oxobacter pfennigii]KPU42271.1 N-acetylglucosamine transferase [Oxobacter pfennigii]